LVLQYLTNTITNIISGINELRSFLLWLLAIPVAACLVWLLYLFIHLLVTDMASSLVFLP
jgi:hypothetical protein